MSYLQTHFWPGGTEEQYRAMIKVLHPSSGLPEGQLTHTSGPAEGGYLISVTWESKDQIEAFMQNTLLPALPVEGGFAGAPEERIAEIAHHDAASS
jgi:selenophosphate synthase